MRKILLSTTSLVFGAALALSVAGPASAGEIGNTVDQAAKDSKVVLDWLEGKAASYGKNDVSYDGPPITLTSTSHVPGVSSLAKLQNKAWANLERMSKGKIKVDASWSASVHSVLTSPIPPANLTTAMRVTSSSVAARSQASIPITASRSAIWPTKAP